MATVTVEHTAPNIILTMSNKEAQALIKVLRHVGGPPDTSRRGLTQNIVRVLEPYVGPGPDDLVGDLMFEEYGR